MREGEQRQAEIIRGKLKTIRDAGIRDKFHCLVVGVEREENVLRAPDPKEPFLEGDIVWIVGESKDVYRLAGQSEYEED